MTVVKTGSFAGFNSELIGFIKSSPTPFHAAASIAEILKAGGFVELKECDVWNLKPGAKHFVLRNRSSVVAFQVPTGEVARQGFRMVGAHTDSPCLRLKPQPEIETCGIFKVGVEIYGGVLLSTWFDRDLSLAGRISYADEKGQVKNAVIDFKRPVAVIPNLAIHLNREVNESRNINKQTEMPPLMGALASVGKNRDFRSMLKAEMERSGIEVAKIFDYELSFYDVQSPSIVGLNEDFLTGARLDNLLSCFIGAKAIVSSSGEGGHVLVCNDHEEVGSNSTSGAQGPFLKAVLERLCGGNENFFRAMDRSMFVSTDNAHAVHPNYPERHDSRYSPLLNQGPAIKINTNQRYATTSETAAIFAQLADTAGVPVQKFVARSDMPCGSTIGPITATLLGVKTLDVGVPTFAMHSVRETAGTRDSHGLFQILTRFYSDKFSVE